MTRDSRDWQSLVKNLLRGEMARRGLSYADLADKLIAIGIKEDRRNLTNKIGRGRFTAVFLLQCLLAMGTRSLHLDDLEEGRS